MAGAVAADEEYGLSVRLANNFTRPANKIAKSAGLVLDQLQRIADMPDPGEKLGAGFLLAAQSIRGVRTELEGMLRVTGAAAEKIDSLGRAKERMGRRAAESASQLGFFQRTVAAIT